LGRSFGERGDGGKKDVFSFERYPQMVTLFGVTLVLLCAVLAVLAGDPQTVFVGYKDGGFAGFQSQFHSVAYVSHTPRGTFVINNSPNSTAVELSVADATKSAAGTSLPILALNG
jgi:hypothetical protein